ncbi:MAG: 1-acyl-sn-glycerol-3-phosphate acyltransferase [Gaiellaceae bacterium]|jgi:1-acyl-sn-glycerol-3-phosphate acyltransferase|nr:1-acyl-sn-glycerol-3-phosphate acyltransferase [Gaiellaceae bacterium]MDX6479236.1 1-acyl-sn-glycerol-3-phosphate acyltransferase [Gaiellaceae bacterium]MDX6509330.1 1-acyl-sn-glycerol-3-phosphate acyltransferase [Gaiellaceae bacterium]MDX6518774.1 1-acyl-sn-glycerol-3-phosphate acyltransferase [Gaiellaceae bacterium]
MRPTATYRAIGTASIPLLRGLYRLRVTGRENIPDEGGFVLAANHNSNFDPWPLGIGLFPDRFLRFMGKSELFWFPLGTFIGAAGAFPVRRGQADLEAIETAVDLCREGHAVVMFPEGTRRKKGLAKRRQAKAHTGAARIALEADVPLVPAAIKGTDRLARFARLSVVYGPPMELDDLRGKDVREAATIATDRLMAEIDRLEATL